ncbi:MAG: glycoside hydrolase family 3 N-terminal domain-containing protein [Bacteroidales bacterium]
MKNNLLHITLLVLLFLAFSSTRFYPSETPAMIRPAFPEYPEFLKSDTAWADSVMRELSLEERIAQMIMVQAFSNMGEGHQKALVHLVREYGIGGILFSRGDPVSQATLTNHLQSVSEVPLLMAMDGENGLGMRLEQVISYPKQISLGAITDNEMIYRMGKDMAGQMKRIGVHLNFAPVADINNNPLNQVIHIRSFGEERENVAGKVVALMRGMQDHGLLVSAKHFPGHGDTGSDSHHALPLIPHDRSRLDAIELYPFKKAIERGLTGIMMAHLHVPALDDRPNRATTLSQPVVTGLLREKMDFRGLIITDALNMKGISDFFEPGQCEVEAVRAGNDILLMPADVGRGISAIRQSVRRGDISRERIDASCRRILLAKYWAGLNRYRPLRTDSLLEDLNSDRYRLHRRKLVEHSLVLVRNRESVLPLRELENTRLATVTVSEKKDHTFAVTSDLYVHGKHFTISPSADYRIRSDLLMQLREYNTIIVNLFDLNQHAGRQYGITDQVLDLIAQMEPSSTLVLNVAGTPYALGRLAGQEHADALIVSFSDDPLSQDLVAQGIFGGIAFRGRLPVTVASVAAAGDGCFTGPAIRLGYADPMEVGLNADTLRRMEDVVRKAIRERAMPGCQLLVARNGKVVWMKAYGYHTYRGRQPVRMTDLYDLASVTKITATLPALMRLRDQGRFHEDSVLGSYLELPDSSDKADLVISDILTHQAGLQSWIPFYYATLEPLDTSQGLVSNRWSHTYPLRIGEGLYANRNVRYADSTYMKAYDPDHPVQVAGDLYLHRQIRDSVYHWIHNSELQSREYRYSDLGFYMLQQVIESITGDTLLYPYVWHQFYAPLGASSLGYLPLNRFSPKMIVPTENDVFFRRQLLRGYVHDPGAAMLGGISGQAGLFGNANDLAKMMQMYLNGGTYGGRRYIDPATIARYSSCINDERVNRRGLGFDRPITDTIDAGPACNDASPLSFGHSGFTGGITWVDPAYDLVYVFLSNRIHPDQGNTKLIDMNVRTEIQQVIYDALEH